MTKKRVLMRIISFALCLVLILSNTYVSAAVFTFETQYDYESANIAWLTDIIIKEDMTSLDGMSQRIKLTAAPDYPYTETAESFKKDVAYFTSLYTISPDSAKAAYLLFFETLNSHSAALLPDASDADIRTYLENAGIKYPSDVGPDELVAARFLYGNMVTGAVSGNLFNNGAGLEQVLISYVVSLTGLDIDKLKKWTEGTSILSIGEYILAASKLTLWNSGYDVNPDTPEDEVYRLIALMSINQQGVSADCESSFDELKTMYIAAMLGARYSVVLDSKKLETAIKNDSVAFYILRLIGKKNGLSVREENCSYEEAFMLVAENTDIFDVEAGEFYADIGSYDIYLSCKRDSLWLYPTAYCTNVSGYVVTISLNGTFIKNNYFNRIALDPDKSIQTLEIKSACSGSSQTSSCTYVIRVHQGQDAAQEPDEEKTTVSEKNKPDYPSSSSLVTDVLASLGLDKLTADILNKKYLSLPTGLTNILPFIAPTFNFGDQSAKTGGDKADEVPAIGDLTFISELDKLGSAFNFVINGIPGIDIENRFLAKSGFDKYVTFG